MTEGTSSENGVAPISRINSSADDSTQQILPARFEPAKAKAAKDLPPLEITKPTESSIDIPPITIPKDEHSMNSSPPGAVAVDVNESGTSRMNELQGELKRETERMNAKVGLIEAQMRLILKLLRRHNKVDPDPEVGLERFDQVVDPNEQVVAERLVEGNPPYENEPRRTTLGRTKKKKEKNRIGPDPKEVEEYSSDLL